MTLKADKELLIKYLVMKVSEEDWHGVADAAMDLRELEVAIKWANPRWYEVNMGKK